MATTRKRQNFIVTALLIACVMILAGVIGDYYFDLNDDCLIKDILSGSYTGSPEGHNIQMLYPIGALISVLYRISRGLDWYGIFLCCLQFGCFFLIIKRTLDIQDSVNHGVFKKVAFVVLELGIMLGLFLPHFLFVQYTVTCGLLSATAAFLIMTKPREQKGMYLLPLTLITLAYLIRSEMLLLTLPMVLMAILIKWAFTCFWLECGCKEKIPFSKYGEKKHNFMAYINLCIGIAACIIISMAVNKLAYSSPEWKEFVRFFDNRTELYDFQSIPDYDENKDFYDSIGLKESSYRLLVNYNFGLDESIDSKMLGRIADYAAANKVQKESLGSSLKRAIPQYVYRLHHVGSIKGYEYPMTDFPWNIVVLILYMVAFIGSFVALNWDKNRIVKSILLLMLMFACRSSLWLFIIIRGRDPIRITHPLYLVEILMLVAVILELFKLFNKSGEPEKKNVNRLLLAMVTASAIVAFVALPMQIGVVSGEITRRKTSMARYAELENYMKQHEKNLFLEDVYTSVGFATVTGKDEATYTEKMFDKRGNNEYNHDLLGGWACKSPLSIKKLKNRGYNSYEEALVSEGVYFVQNLNEDTDWIVNYYADKGQSVSVTHSDTVAEVFGIYEVRKVAE